MERKNNQNKSPNAENDPANAMDNKRKVEQSNDPKTDQDFPGYPHYPAKEDIMDQRTDSHRVDMDIENLPSAHNATGVSQRFITAQESKRSGNEPVQDEQDDELSVLNSKDEEIGTPQNISNEELTKNSSESSTNEEGGFDEQ